MRFIAYWNKGKEHCNIKCAYYGIEDNIIALVNEKNQRVGMFDEGFLDAWYVSDEERKGTDANNR